MVHSFGKTYRSTLKAPRVYDKGMRAHGLLHGVHLLVKKKKTGKHASQEFGFPRGNFLFSFLVGFYPNYSILRKDEKPHGAASTDLAACHLPSCIQG